MHATFCLLATVVLAFGTHAEIFYQSREIRSPGYPRAYPENVNKEWVFNQTVGKWILTMEDFDIEESRSCEKDYLEIIGKHEPERICGNLPYESHVTKGAILTLRFKTDAELNGKGFRLKITHSFDEADLKAKLEQLRKKNIDAAEALVIERKHETEFYVLIGVLGVALLVFAILLVSFIFGLWKRRRETKRYQTQLVRNMQSQVSYTGSTGRRYSRGKMTSSYTKEPSRTRLTPTSSNQMSPTFTNQMSPTFANQMSPTFTNQMSPTFTNQMSPTFSNQMSPTSVYSPDSSTSLVHQGNGGTGRFEFPPHEGVIA